MGKQGRGQWYVIVYDIREARRLRKLHRYLKKRALALQKSVFLLQTDQAGLESILAGVKEQVHDREDDVRLYPVRRPDAIWAAGAQAKVLRGLFAGAPEQPVDTGKFGKLLSKIFRGKKK